MQKSGMKYLSTSIKLTILMKASLVTFRMEAAALRKEGQFLSVPEHTGLIMCCDGVPVFKSSG